MKIETVKGFSDFLGNDARKRLKIKQIIEETFLLYGYEPSETPIIEFEEFVKGKNSDDEAVRDVYRLEDRAKRKLALRYEFTFQLKRIAKGQKLPYKRFQIGYNFRDEPIKKGRLRQFVQCDCDIVGSNIKDEAEILLICSKILKKLGIKNTIYINNRKLINEILVSENIEEKNREQVIRELDKIEKLPKSEVAKNLKKLNAERILKKFDEGEKYFEKYKFYSEIKELKQLCEELGIKVKFKPTLARGLSYYNGTIFEVESNDIKVSICGGGSYLIDEIQSTGFSIGLEPVFLISNIESDKIDFGIISIQQDKKANDLAEKLRNNGKKTQVILDKTIKKALEYANTKEIQKIIIVGKDEIKSKLYTVKEMFSGKERKYSEEELMNL
ncbi:MAG: ATP phosphoribosyltransferase regulatory subunit [Candidatus Nanoarchaeia archaeon]|nr:ATP phosphoribosyltransferase regulatory subunit [Candidatus Nanoarchaeia archaeon]